MDPARWIDTWVVYLIWGALQLPDTPVPLKGVVGPFVASQHYVRGSLGQHLEGGGLLRTIPERFSGRNRECN